MRRRAFLIRSLLGPHNAVKRAASTIAQDTRSVNIHSPALHCRFGRYILLVVINGHQFVYIVRCADGSLFTGVTSEIEQNLQDINSGAGAPYTRTRLPVFLAHTEEYMNEIDASKREAQIKRMTRKHKEILLAGVPAGIDGELAFAS